MNYTGKHLPIELKETSLGGFAPEGCQTVPEEHPSCLDGHLIVEEAVMENDVLDFARSGSIYEQRGADTVVHPFAPIYDAHSRVLILGSLPSVASRQQAFYYAHPRNRFWPVMAALDGSPLDTTAQRVAFLHRRHFALWDVIASCTITGSSDASIRDVTANDFNRLLAETEIKTIVTTGKTAGRCYQKYAQPKTGIAAIVLPSTSPANAAVVSFEQLLEAYRFLFEL